MKQFSSKEIRETFLNYFKQNDHLIIPGSSIIPKNDPTLLFINSGMAPMKRYFLGMEQPPYQRMANVQACIRTNDIEDVGDRHHLTFFEMMGSWSIGDYYKERAIELAYDLLVNYFHFPPEKLYATIYKGNPALNLGPDEEAIRCWEKAGMPSDHIVPMGEDNFWGPAGDTGPCGPCTEVFFDTGESYGPQYVPGGHFDDVNRYIEIWNAGVFMELNKDKDGRFTPLPMKSVDTGSGIERMYLALNGSRSIYDVDTIRPVYRKVESLLGSEDITEREIRLVTDHMRTCTFLLGEGITPDKDGRGYIPRRLIRKSIACVVRAGKSSFELENIAEEVISQMGEWYPHLAQNRAMIMSALHQEIEDFTPVIHAGLQMLQDKISKLDNDTLDGEFIFDLVTTHGLPLEVITDFTEKKGLKVDKEKYLEEYRRHQEISRSGLKGKIRAVDGKDTDSMLENALAGFEKTGFYGYDQSEGTGKLLAIFANGEWIKQAAEGTECQLVFDATPFYAESGGQVGDTGIAEGPEFMAEITDTQKKKNIFLHKAIVRKGTVSTGDVVNLKVDAERRKSITKNHTATHLLHASLRKVLGSHVVQKGSLVNNEKLRFDFLHNKPMTAEEISRVESLINSWIWENYGADIREMSYQEALDTGAMALFNENYGDRVRVVRFGDVSAELCGGVHVRATGEIGLVLINQEMSVAKGIRRVEAVSGPIAYHHVTRSREILQTASSLVAAKPENLVQQVEKLKKNASAKVQAPVKAPEASEISFTQEKSFFLPSGIKVFTGRLDQDVNVMQQAAEKILQNQEADIVFLASGHEETVKVIVLVSAASQANYPADKLIRQWLEPFSGKGGGKPAMAKGGMKETGRVDELAEAAAKIFV